MENLEQISKKYKKMLAWKNKECLIENDEYILCLNHEDKNGNKTFRCKFYKDNQIKCKAFAKFDRNIHWYRIMTNNLALLMKKKSHL